MQSRLLHYTLARILLPKHSNFAQVSGDKVVLLWGMKQEKKMNWAHLVVTHMIRCKNAKTRPLLYGILITKLLCHFGISISGELVLKGSDAYHMFGSATINQMHLIQFKSHWYYPTVGSSSCVEYGSDAPRPPSPPPATASAPAPGAPSSSSFTMEQFQSLFDRYDARQQERFDSLQRELSQSREAYDDLRGELLLSREMHSREIEALGTRLAALETYYAGLGGTSSAAPDPDHPMDTQDVDLL